MSQPRTISGMPCGVTPAATRKIEIAAIHGILTRQTIASWPDHFDAWMFERAPSIHVAKKEYLGGPIPMWNVWVKNHLLARGLFAELRLFGLAGAWISLVAHSNGCDVALKTTKLLAAAGIKVQALILTGAAINSDVEDSGILRLVKDGHVRRAIAYCSRGDDALSSPLIWPYGRLGFQGWQLGGRLWNGNPQIQTRWFDVEHGGYYDGEQRERTFRQIYSDVLEATGR